MNKNCTKCNINKIEHRYLCLCSICYKAKRKQDWASNEQIRKLKNPNRAQDRKDYCKQKYHKCYREFRLVDNQCIDCGAKALKGSHYTQCKECSHTRMSKKKVEYQKDRKKNHLPTKIRENLSSRLKAYLKSNNKRKDSSIVDFLGCSIPNFIIYLEDQFTEGMTWDNYGKWHMDHIRPLVSFDVSNEKELLKMSHYTNLQPLWAKDNLSKGAKYDKKDI